MDEIGGLPAHPLIVHAPIVLIPLTGLVVALLIVRPRWFGVGRWPLLALSSGAAIGGILAAASGESLEDEARDRGAARRFIREHAEAGELARTVGVVLLLVVVAWVVVSALARRRAADGAAPAALRWIEPLLRVAAALVAVASVVAVVDAGHSGAESVWGDETEGDELDDGGEGGDDDGGDDGGDDDD